VLKLSISNQTPFIGLFGSTEIRMVGQSRAVKCHHFCPPSFHVPCFVVNSGGS
jgi:hypothetical protein